MKKEAINGDGRPRVIRLESAGVELVDYLAAREVERSRLEREVSERLGRIRRVA